VWPLVRRVNLEAPPPAKKRRLSPDAVTLAVRSRRPPSFFSSHCAQRVDYDYIIIDSDTDEEEHVAAVPLRETIDISSDGSTDDEGTDNVDAPRKVCSVLNIVPVSSPCRRSPCPSYRCPRQRGGRWACARIPLCQ
jgi:hypothetical protein